jgi:hypothetical protein
VYTSFVYTAIALLSRESCTPRKLRCGTQLFLYT